MLKEQLINEARIQAVQERFEEWPGPAKSTFPFKWWLGVFSRKRNSFREIAESVSCTKENVRQLYRNYFAPLFPGFPNGRSRRRFSNLEQWTVKARDFSNAPEKLRKIAKIARSWGFTVEKNPTFSGGRPVSFSSCSLLINRKRCSISRITHIWIMPLGKRLYSHTHISVNTLRKYDFLIVLQEVKDYPRRVFVIPVSILLRRWGKREKRTTLCIPLKRYPVYHNCPPKLDFWQYLDAWYLLGNR